MSDTVAKQKRLYETISAEHLARLQTKIPAAANLYPDAGLVGGAALRLWCELLGRPIPEEFGADIDIVQTGIAESYDNRTSPAGWIDIFPSEVPLAEPFFRQVAYHGALVTVATLPHLFVRKMIFIREGIAERDNVMRKDLVYVDVLDSLVDRNELAVYAQAVQEANHAASAPDYEQELRDLRATIGRLQAEGKIHDAVHPENAVNHNATS